MKQEIEWLDNTAENLENITMFDKLLLKCRQIAGHNDKVFYISGTKSGNTFNYWSIDARWRRDLPPEIAVDAFAVLVKDEEGAL